MKRSAWKSYLIFLLIPLAVGGGAFLLTRDAMAGYELLRRPPLAPPGWLFSVVWPLLYLLMGLSAAIIFRSGSSLRGKVLFLWGLQLFVNFWWPIFFFAWEQRLLALFWLGLLVLLSAKMLASFRRIRPLAGRMNIPYLLWLLFAFYLNLSVWLLNS